MILSVGCALDYQVQSPTAHFTFNVLVNTDAHQRLLDESLAFAPAGPFEVRYAATVEVTRPPAAGRGLRLTPASCVPAGGRCSAG
jgi:hypothetical protein